MGEAVYYLKARFSNEEQASAGKDRINALLAEGRAADNFWQAHRRDKPSAFWPEFFRQFPLVMSYFREHCEPRHDGGQFGAVDLACNNTLADCLNFGTEGEEAEIGGGEAIVYVSANVWHMADWGGFAAWIKALDGCEKVAWISDEDASIFDTLDV
jgi:hypothetical protein